MDPQTASIALVIAQLCVSITMIGVYFAAPNETYTRLWSLSGAMTAIGITLILFNLSRPPGLVLITGNILLFSGCVVAWIGLRSFFDKKMTRWAYVLIALFSLLYILLVANAAHINYRVLLNSSGLILIFLLCLQTIVAPAKHRGFKGHGYARAMAVVGLLMMIGAHTTRMVLLLMQSANVNHAGAIQINAAIIYLIPLAGTVLFFPSLLLLYFERIKHQLLLTLKAKQEALDIQTRFVDMFSHEYRTPLAVIRTNLHIIQSKDQVKGQQFGANLDKMQRAVLRLVEVAETALMSDQTADWTVAARGERIPMPDFIRDIIQQASEFWSDRDPTFTLRSTAPHIVHGDVKLLKTAILNVLDNAIKYGPEHGSVDVALSMEQGASILVVEDRGPGIPAHELDLVYGKYFRGSRAGGVSGSGIGLYLVRRIIDQHNGRITLSNRPQGGTSATIVLPLPTQEGQGIGGGNQSPVGGG